MSPALSYFNWRSSQNYEILSTSPLDVRPCIASVLVPYFPVWWAQHLFTSMENVVSKKDQPAATRNHHNTISQGIVKLIFQSFRKTQRNIAYTRKFKIKRTPDWIDDLIFSRVPTGKAGLRVSKGRGLRSQTLFHLSKGLIPWSHFNLVWIQRDDKRLWK